MTHPMNRQERRALAAKAKRLQERMTGRDADARLTATIGERILQSERIGDSMLFAATLAADGVRRMR